MNWVIAHLEWATHMCILTLFPSAFSLSLYCAMTDLHSLVQLPSEEDWCSDQGSWQGFLRWNQPSSLAGNHLGREVASGWEEGEDEGAQDCQRREGPQLHCREGSKTGRNRCWRWEIVQKWGKIVESDRVVYPCVFMYILPCQSILNVPVGLHAVVSPKVHYGTKCSWDLNN